MYESERDPPQTTVWRALLRRGDERCYATLSNAPLLPPCPALLASIQNGCLDLKRISRDFLRRMSMRYPQITSLFEVLFQQPGPTTFKFRDEVFFNSRSGERYFMNRLWHNHPPLEVEKTYSVVPGYSPPIYIYDDMDRIAFNDSTLKAIPWPGEEIDPMQPKLGERIVKGKYLSSYQEDTMTVEMAKAVLSKTELYKRQFEISTDLEARM